MLKLKRTIGRSYDTDPEDVLNVKQALNRVGVYAIPNHGLTPYADRETFEAIERYQRLRGLTVDGAMKQGGETERDLNDNEAEESPPAQSRDEAIFSFDGGAIRRVALEETEHWRVTRDFPRDPDRILAALFDDE